MSALGEPAPRGWSRLQKKVVSREVNKRRKSWRADARGALRVTITLDAFADGANRPGGLSGNAFDAGGRGRNREFLCPLLPVARACSAPTSPHPDLLRPRAPVRNSSAASRLRCSSTSRRLRYVNGRERTETTDQTLCFFPLEFCDYSSTKQKIH